jgi:hypothetical protein
MKPLAEVSKMTLDEMKEYMERVAQHLHAVRIEYNYKLRKDG